jgi:hypothetical protein
LRLTQCRARKLLGRSLRLGSHRFLWSPTRHDQLQPGCSPAPIEGRLLVARLVPAIAPKPCICSPP